MKNALGLRHRGLHRLRVGEAVLVGPYRTAKAVSTLIYRCRLRPGCDDRQFTQRQLLLADPAAGACHKMYLVTRTAAKPAAGAESLPTA